MEGGQQPAMVQLGQRRGRRRTDFPTAPILSQPSAMAGYGANSDYFLRFGLEAAPAIACPCQAGQGTRTRQGSPPYFRFDLGLNAGGLGARGPRIGAFCRLRTRPSSDHPHPNAATIQRNTWGVQARTAPPTDGVPDGRRARHPVCVWRPLLISGRPARLDGGASR